MHGVKFPVLSRVRTRPEILEKLWKIGKSNSRPGKVMEKCNFGQMSWNCPGIYFGPQKNFKNSTFPHEVNYCGERTGDRKK